MRQIHDVFSNFDKAKDVVVRDFLIFDPAALIAPARW